MKNISDNQPEDSTVDEKYEILSSALLVQEIKDNLDKSTTSNATLRLERDEPGHHPKNDLANALKDYLDDGQEVIPDLEDQDPDYNYSSYIPGEIDHHRYKLLHDLHDKGIINVKDHRAKEEIAETGRLFDQVQFYEVNVNEPKFTKYYTNIVNQAKPYIEDYLKQHGSTIDSSTQEIQQNEVTKAEQSTQNNQNRSKQKHKITLRLQQRTLRLYIDGNDTSYKVIRFKTVSGNNFIACKALYSHKKHWLTREQLGLTNAKTVVKDMPKTMNITGPLQEHFLEFNSDSQTMQMRDIVQIDDYEKEKLVNYVNAHFSQ